MRCGSIKGSNYYFLKGLSLWQAINFVAINVKIAD